MATPFAPSPRAARAVLAAALLAAPTPAAAQTPLLLRPQQVWDGVADRAQPGWVVLIRGERIAAVGPAAQVDATGARVVDLPGTTLLPGLIENHSHLLLHPYDEARWDDQVLKESLALRVARATVHARRTLDAGFTTVRDLGTEGAGYADVGLRQAVAQGIIPGPRIVTTTRAIVATGSYGPTGFDPAFRVPQGAEEADGVDALTRVVRDQIGRGADWIKVYADYRWGPGGEARPTFTEEELALIVRVAASSGRSVAAHAATAEGMRRAARAGVRTIEHGDGGTAETWALLRDRGVALCPTLAAPEATARYAGWKKGTDPVPARIRAKADGFRAAVAAGVEICLGGDVGVYAHGDDARELELLVEYGLSPVAALRAATSTNAAILGLGERLGRVAPGYLADLIAVGGDPLRAIAAVRDVRLVVQGGLVVRAAP